MAAAHGKQQKPHADPDGIADGPTASSDKSFDETIRLETDRDKKIEAAYAEGHDADIPSSIGYILDEQGELKRQRSIADQRSLALARTRSHASHKTGHAGDVEKAEGPLDGTDDAKEVQAAIAAVEADRDLVWWDSDDDPANPYNWPTWRKATNCTLISMLTFVVPLASSIFAPGVPQLMQDFGSDSSELAAFVVSVYILGFAFGPLFIAPMSEIYGRNPVYHVCNICFTVFLIACALAPTLNALIAFRFLSGMFGSCPLTNGGGSIADMIRQEKRAAAMAAFSIGPLLGPIIGPVAGGFLAAAKGWRWVFWVLVIIAGFATILMLVCMRETYAPVILERKTNRLRKETGNEMLRSKLDVGLSPSDYFKRGIIRPFKMLLLSPVVTVVALYMAVVYGYLYLMFTSMTEVFEGYYGFSTQDAGLAYLGLGVGSMSGLVIFSLTSDRHLKKMSAKEGAGMKPEYRLQPLPIGAILLPIGLFIYGWTAEYRVHWIVPILGTTVIGIGNLIIFLALQMYLVDAFTLYAASALAANTVIRSIAGGILPLAGLQMYAALGVGWGNSLLAFIAVALLPVPFLVVKKGEWLRTKFPLKNL
ncbi:bicyclomycin resistance protein [Coniella lustricola]|uniref:Bicyclomycin resistance protein n=1 Tax=Coniella lustricola TaxID=2025994 RepID=A0A2T3A4Q8_9PEZI|nr:bicyclomycin resistance protein [Coniella lustricola]